MPPTVKICAEIEEVLDQFFELFNMGITDDKKKLECLFADAKRIYQAEAGSVPSFEYSKNLWILFARNTTLNVIK